MDGAFWREKHAKGYIEGLDMLASMRLCSNVLAQQVIQTSLGGTQSIDELLLPGGRIYEQREFIYKAMNEFGISAVKPKAFSIFSLKSIGICMTFKMMSNLF